MRKIYISNIPYIIIIRMFSLNIIYNLIADIIYTIKIILFRACETTGIIHYNFHIFEYISK